MSEQVMHAPSVDLWRRPAFCWLAVTAVLSYLGDQMYLVALPWLALQLTGSSLALGTVLMAAAIPRALLILLGGALSDRLTPKTVMLFSSGVSALITAGFAGLIMLSSIAVWHLYAVAVLLGVIDAVFYPAARTILPTVLPKSQLAKGNAVGSLIAQGSAIIGPGIAGALVAVNPELAFAASALASVLSVAALGFVKPTQTQDVASVKLAKVTDNSRRAGLLADIAEGLRYAWRDPVIRGLMLLIAALSVALQGPLIVGGGLLANERFDGAASFGILLSGWGLGGLLGAVIAGSFNAIRQQGWLLIIISVVFGVSMSAVGFSTELWIAVAIMSLMGFCEGFVEVQTVTWLQTYGEARLQGRLISLITFASVGLEPFSYGFAGLLGEFDPTIMFLGAGAFILLATGISASNKALRDIQPCNHYGSVARN